MGKLNIAHHKSYHPYRRDNIERVRRDEEAARLQQLKDEGKLLMAVSPLPTTTASDPGSSQRFVGCRTQRLV